MFEVIVKAEEEHLPGFIPAADKDLMARVGNVNSMHYGTWTPGDVTHFGLHGVAHRNARCSVAPTGPVLANHLPCKRQITQFLSSGLMSASMPTFHHPEHTSRHQRMHAGGYESMCQDMTGTAVVLTCLEESAVRLAIISQSPGGAAAQYICQVEHLQRDINCSDSAFKQLHHHICSGRTLQCLEGNKGAASRGQTCQ